MLQALFTVKFSFRSLQKDTLLPEQLELLKCYNRGEKLIHITNFRD